jgi:hypothetical protein
VFLKKIINNFKIKIMTAKNFFTFQGIMNMAFGLGLMLVPQMMVDTYGTTKSIVTDVFDIIARGYGTLLFGLGITAFLMRNAQPSLARYAYLAGTVIACILVTTIHIKAILDGTENSMAWLTVLITGSIGVWSGLLLSKEKQDILV